MNMEEANPSSIMEEIEILEGRNTEQEEILLEFITVTREDEESATKCLESVEWDLEKGLKIFYEMLRTSFKLEESYDVSGSASSFFSKSNESQREARYMGGLYKMASLDDMQDVIKEEEFEYLSAVGIRPYLSGEAPEEAKMRKLLIKKLFREAKERREMESPFIIVDSQAITGMRQTQELINEQTRDFDPPVFTRWKVTVVAWREGFTVGSGPLRDYNNPDNKPFLDSLKDGSVPEELLSQAEGRIVDMLIDYRVADKYGDTNKKKGKKKKGKKKKAKQLAHLFTRIKVDQSEPTTTIHVKLADGTRFGAFLNYTHTVGDLKRCIGLERTEYIGRKFSLLAAYPTRELDDNLTVEEANILDSGVMQIMK